MSDPAEDICDAIVDYLNGLQDTDSPFEFVFTAENPENIQDELEREALDTIKVLVVPFGESEIKTDKAGTALLSIDVSLIVLRKLDAQATRKSLASLTWAIRQQLRGKKQAGYTWSGAETLTKFSPEHIAKLNQFHSGVRLNYTGMVR